MKQVGEFSFVYNSGFVAGMWLSPSPATNSGLRSTSPFPVQYTVPSASVKRHDAHIFRGPSRRSTHASTFKSEPVGTDFFSVVSTWEKQSCGAVRCGAVQNERAFCVI